MQCKITGILHGFAVLIILCFVPPLTTSIYSKLLSYFCADAKFIQIQQTLRLLLDQTKHPSAFCWIYE